MCECVRARNWESEIQVRRKSTVSDMPGILAGCVMIQALPVTSGDDHIGYKRKLVEKYYRQKKR
jgi:hypothetical protein